MNVWLRRIELKLDGLALRERVLVLGLMLIALFLMADTLAFRPLQGRAKLASEERARLEEEQRGLETRASELEVALAQDPRRAERDELARLEAELAGVDAELRQRTADLVSPRQMADVLARVLGSQPAIHVDSVETLPAEPLVPVAKSAPGKPGAVQDGFYRHALRIELHATFNETLAFLAVVEKLPVALLWHRLEYRVEQYPRARVTLEIFTLGPREGSVGV